MEKDKKDDGKKKKTDEDVIKDLVGNEFLDDYDIKILMDNKKRYQAFKEGKLDKPVSFENSSILNIRVESKGFEAGKEAKIWVNDNLVKIKVNANGHHRGMNLVGVNPLSHQVTMA